MIAFKVHARNISELNSWQFGIIFDRRGLSSCWQEDKIWSYGFPDRYRYWHWNDG